MLTQNNTALRTSYGRGECFSDSYCASENLPSSGVAIAGGRLTQATLSEMVSAPELARLSFSRLSPSGEEQLWNGSVICFPRNGERSPIPLLAEVRADTPIMITDLPCNGSVFLSDGRSAVICGQTISAAQLR